MLDEGALSASSPDEQAFVAAAEYFGYEFTARHDDKGYICVRDKRLNETYEVKGCACTTRRAVHCVQRCERSDDALTCRPSPVGIHR